MAYTKYKDIPNRREPLGGRDHIQHIETGLLAVSNNVGGSAYESLDIWPEFNANGGAGSWSALTYADYIAGLDASLSGQISSGTVIKTDLGVASNGTSRVYSYTAGNGPIRVLLVAGQHGEELFGMWASMRWFQSFITSNDPAMRQMRDAFRVTWIPSLNAANYHVTRTNANGVDLNRNYDVLWSRATETDKGAAPFDQPESQMIRDLLDADPFFVVIDCHNYTAQGNTFGFGIPGHWYLGARQFGIDAIQQWQRLYGNLDYTWFSSIQTRPTLPNYANYQMRHLKGRENSATFLIEASLNLHGSSLDHVTRPAMRAYAGMIQTYLQMYLANNGRATAEPYTYSMSGYRASQSASTPIADGGTLSDSGTLADFRVDHIKPDGVQVQYTEIPVPLMVTPATVLVEVAGSMRSMGNAVGRHSINAYMDGTAMLGGLVNVTVSDVNLQTTNFSFIATRVFPGTISNTGVPVVTFPMRRISGGAAEVYTFTYKITVIPSTNGHMAARTDGA